jgi:hypothetical protein
VLPIDSAQLVLRFVSGSLESRILLEPFHGRAPEATT